MTQTGLNIAGYKAWGSHSTDYEHMWRRVVWYKSTNVSEYPAVPIITTAEIKDMQFHIWYSRPYVSL
jgi:hypothetical protein